MKKFLASIAFVVWTMVVPLATQETKPRDWKSTRDLLDMRTGEISSWSTEVNQALDAFRASPDFEKHAGLWADYLRATNALQAAVDAGTEVDKQAALRKTVGDSKTALEQASADSPLLKQVHLLLSQGKKLVEVQDPARAALGEAARILREAKVTTDRISDLKSERDKLAERIATAERVVAVQQDPAAKGKNLQIIAQAKKQLSEMDKSLVTLESLAATNRDRLQAIAGDAEAAARLAKEVEVARGRWNDAQLRLNDNLNAIRQFLEVRAPGVAELRGNVKIRRLDGTVVDAKYEMKLLPGETIHAEKNSQAVLRLDDGSKIMVRAESSYEVEPSKKSNDLETLVFKSGVLRYVNAFKHAATRRHAVRTSTCASAVKGCDMLVFTSDEQLRVCLIEGEFILCHRNGEVVPAGNEITVTAGTLETVIRPLTPEAYRKLLIENFPDVD